MLAVQVTAKYIHTATPYKLLSTYYIGTSIAGWNRISTKRKADGHIIIMATIPKSENGRQKVNRFLIIYR